jgi:hypothetical protein
MYALGYGHDPDKFHKEVGMMCVEHAGQLTDKLRREGRVTDEQLQQAYAQAMEFMMRKLQRELDSGIDPTKIRWCRTCKHLKKMNGEEPQLIGMEEALPVDQLPCSLGATTEQTWTTYFALPMEKRTLFPKNCPSWERA